MSIVKARNFRFQMDIQIIELLLRCRHKELKLSVNKVKLLLLMSTGQMPVHLKGKDIRRKLIKGEHSRKEKGKPDSKSLLGPKGHDNFWSNVCKHDREKRKKRPTSDLEITRI